MNFLIGVALIKLRRESWADYACVTCGQKLPHEEECVDVA